MARRSSKFSRLRRSFVPSRPTGTPSFACYNFKQVSKYLDSDQLQNVFPLVLWDLTSVFFPEICRIRSVCTCICLLRSRRFSLISEKHCIHDDYVILTSSFRTFLVVHIKNIFHPSPPAPSPQRDEVVMERCLNPCWRPYISYKNVHKIYQITVIILCTCIQI